MRVSRAAKVLTVAAVLLAALSIATAAGAQTPMPGESPEPIREWVWYLSFPVILGTVAMLLLVAFSYARLSSRFYAREEPPKPRRQPVYAGVNAPAYPAPVTAQAAPASAAAGAAPAAAPAAEQAPPPPAPESPAPERPAAREPAAPPQEEAPAAETAEQGAPAAEAPQAAKEEQPAAEAAPQETPQAAKEEQPAAEQAPAEKKAAPDDDVYERVLKEQLDKGVSPKVAEGRAKAAALKAARQAGGG